MKEGWEVEEKEIVSNGYVYDHDFGLWKVYTKPNELLYWHTKTKMIDRIATFTPQEVKH